MCVLRCHEEGRAYLETHLERIPLTSNKRATKVLNICKQYELLDLGESACRPLPALRCVSSPTCVLLPPLPDWLFYC